MDVGDRRPEPGLASLGVRELRAAHATARRAVAEPRLDGGLRREDPPAAGAAGDPLHERLPAVQGAGDERQRVRVADLRSEEHTSELQSLMRISYAVFCLKKKKKHRKNMTDDQRRRIREKNKE